MEYHCSDGKVVASRIFERGLDVFGDEIEYVVRYLGFLISINDENSKSRFFFISFISQWSSELTALKSQSQMPVLFSNVSSQIFHQNVPARYGNAGHDMSISMGISRLRSSWKSGWRKYMHQVIHSIFYLFSIGVWIILNNWFLVIYRSSYQATCAAAYVSWDRCDRRSRLGLRHCATGD